MSYHSIELYRKVSFNQLIVMNYIQYLTGKKKSLNFYHEHLKLRSTQ